MLLVRSDAQLFAPGTALVRKQHDKRLVLVDLAQKERLDTFPVVLPARWTRELARSVCCIGTGLARTHQCVFVDPAQEDRLEISPHCTYSSVVTRIGAERSSHWESSCRKSSLSAPGPCPPHWKRLAGDFSYYLQLTKRLN